MEHLLWAASLTIIVGGLIWLLTFAVTHGRYYLSQITRRRAHEGRLKCQSKRLGIKREPCSEIATRVTAVGYFCDDHFAENRRTLGALYSINWAHRLDWVRFGKR